MNYKVSDFSGFATAIVRLTSNLKVLSSEAFPRRKRYVGQTRCCRYLNREDLQVSYTVEDETRKANRAQIVSFCRKRSDADPFTYQSKVCNPIWAIRKHSCLPCMYNLDVSLRQLAWCARIRGSQPPSGATTLLLQPGCSSFYGVDG